MKIDRLCTVRGARRTTLSALALAALTAFAACAPADDEADDAMAEADQPAEMDDAGDTMGEDAMGGLWGSSWQLVDLAGDAPLEDVSATIQFPEAGRVNGNGSCNQFTGTASVEGDSISLGPLAMTRRACRPPIGEQESRYAAALNAAHGFEIDGDELRIHTTAEEAPLRFTRTANDEAAAE